MCYSATASFVSAASLLPISVVASVLAVKKHPRFFLLTLVPLFFAMQQLAEGMVWLSLNQDNSANVITFSYAYLFFAFFFWPIYMPIAVLRTEANEQRRLIIRQLCLIGWILGLLMYGPIITGFIPVHVSIMQHSVQYSSYQSAAVCYTFGVSYIAAGIAPFWVSSFRSLRWLGSVIFLSLVISVISFAYAFTSIWCYFVAIISMLILLIVFWDV